ncbi:MAG: hypothetical protein ACJ8F1_02720 [Polyangia bacterium]
MRTGSLCAGVCLALLSTVAISCSSSDMMTTTSGTGGSPGGATGGSGGGATGICGTLMNYTPTTSTAPSFAADIYPIFSKTDPGSSSKPAPGCGQTILCHGSPAVSINMASTASLSFVDSPATVKAALLANAVNAPTMKRVDPGHVGSSFLAYKISGAAGVACVSSSCPAGVTVGNTKPCGDPMPNANGQGGTAAVLTDAERSKILDWIALGAHD